MFITNVCFLISHCHSMYDMYLLQDNLNLVISNDYSEQAKRAMAMMSEKETSFELIEVKVQHTAQS